MIGGTERVAVAVDRVVAVAEEILGVVVAARVLERNRFVAVDVPDCGVLHQLHRSSVCEDVVEGAQLTVKLIRSLVVVLLGLDDVETAVDQCGDCVFLGVRIEVAYKEGRQVSPIFLFTEVLQ